MAPIKKHARAKAKPARAKMAAKRKTPAKRAGHPRKTGL
jgi:hypothetical protein